MSGTADLNLQKIHEKMEQYEILMRQMSGKLEESTRRLNFAKTDE
jgi:hypothetical protein